MQDPLQLLKKTDGWRVFKEWVESTKLFNVLKEETHSSYGNFVQRTIVTKDPPMRIDLNPEVAINNAEDLPVEVIMEFYRNSPFYKEEQEINNEIKLLK